MQQLGFDFPFPKLTNREFSNLKRDMEREERDIRFTFTPIPDWLVNKKEQYKELCASRGHVNGKPWDNGIGCVSIRCVYCGATTGVQHYELGYEDNAS